MFRDTTKNAVTGLPSTQMDIFTTLEECSDGELGGCRTACRVELPPLSMLRWDSDSVRSDSPPSEVRYSLSPGPARCSRAPSGWYLPGGHTRVTKILFTCVFTCVYTNHVQRPAAELCSKKNQIGYSSVAPWSTVYTYPRAKKKKCNFHL